MSHQTPFTFVKPVVTEEAWLELVDGDEEKLRSLLRTTAAEAKEAAEAAGITPLAWAVRVQMGRDLEGTFMASLVLEARVATEEASS